MDYAIGVGRGRRPTRTPLARPIGNDLDREEEVPEIVLPEVAAEPDLEPIALPWQGRGNVIAAAGVALLDFARVR